MLSRKAYQTHVSVLTRDGSEVEPPSVSLSPGQLELFSSDVPALLPGDYSIAVTQSVAPTATPGQSKLNLKTTKAFTVVRPKPSDAASHIYSVYPAPGHSDYGNTLPHVTFSTPNAPWEIQVDDSWGSGSRLAKTPWLAVMSFTEDELRLDQETLRDHKLEGLKQTSDLTLRLTAATLQSLGNQHVAVPRLYVDDGEQLSVILLKLPLFKALFGWAPDGQDKPDLSRFAFLAHARHVSTTGTSASNGYWEQDRFSIIIGSRVAPSVPEGKPRAISTHLVSLDGISAMTIGDADLVALPVAYSWTWMAIPDTHVNFEHVARALGENIGPLVMPGRPGVGAPVGPSPADTSTAAEEDKRDGPGLEMARARDWIRKRVADGYTICPHVLPTGEKTAAIFRGVLSPVVPQVPEKPPFSLLGTDLEIVDRLTGLIDVSFSAAWQLGRTLAIADPSFSRSLLRLRGQIHHKSVVAAQALVAKDVHITRNHAARGLDAMLDAVATSHNPAAAQLASRMPHRWTQACFGLPALNRRKGTSRASNAVRHARASCLEDCARQMARRVGHGSTVEDPTPYKLGTVAACHDWPVVLQWVLEKLYLGDLPSRYLVPDSSALPKESIRTFYVDTAWLEAVVDGALSIGNHWEKDDDDPIRRAIKDNINEYLAYSRDGDRGEPIQTQVPRWGFMIRSSIVQAFPDLRIEVPYPEGEASRFRRDVLSVQRVAEDILVCLLDREPRDGTMQRIVISQPEHQPSFQLGSNLDWEANELTVDFRLTPNLGSSADLGNKTSVAKTWRKADGGENPPIFDWENRVLISPSFADTCVSNMRVDGYFAWPEGPEERSSALVAAQLSRKTLQLVIRVEPPVRTGVPGPGLGVHVPAAAPHKPFQLQLPPHSQPVEDQPPRLAPIPSPLVDSDSQLPARPKAPLAVHRSPLKDAPSPGESPPPYHLVKLPLGTLLGDELSSGRSGLNLTPSFAVLEKGSLRAISELPDMPHGTRTYHVGLALDDNVAFDEDWVTYLSEILVLFNLQDYLVILSHDDLIAALRSGDHVLRARPAWSVAPAASWVPTVEPCSLASAWWRYDRFVVSDADERERYFCVRIRARSRSGGWPASRLSGVDMSFVLRGVRTVNANRTAKVTVVQQGWRDGPQGKAEWKEVIGHAIGTDEDS